MSSTSEGLNEVATNNSWIRRNKKKLACSSICYCASTVIALLLTVILWFTLPSLRVGGTIVSGSDVVLISSFNSPTIVTFAAVRTGYTLDVLFYKLRCSELETRTFSEVANITRQLTVLENMQYRIDELYLIEGSQVLYNFTSLERRTSTAPVANISVSSFEFAESKEFVTKLEDSYCLLPMESLIFYVTPSENSYYSIEVDSFNSTILNYTVMKDVLRYNVTDLSFTTACPLYIPSYACSISLDTPPSGQEMCVLASIAQETDGFVLLGYATRYTSSQRSQLIAVISMLCATFLPPVCVIFLCVLHMCRFTQQH